MYDTAPIPAYLPPAQRSGGRVRSAAAVLCLLLATLLTVPAGFAFWGQRTVIDTQRYAATIGPLIRSEAVQNAIATRVTDAIDKEIAVGGSTLNRVLSGVLTDAGTRQKVLGALTGVVEGQVNSQVRQFIASPAFAVIWDAANVEAQRDFLRVLKGDNTGVLALHGSQIVLNLSVVISQVEQRLAAAGLTFAKHLPIPNSDAQIVLANAPHLGLMRSAYGFANTAGAWLLGVVAALYVGALALARRRARMAAIIGIAMVANAALAALLVSVVRHNFIDEYGATAFGPASALLYDTLLSYVRHGAAVLFGLGVGVGFVGWCVSSTNSAATVRQSLRGGFARIGVRKPARAIM